MSTVLRVGDIPTETSSAVAIKNMINGMRPNQNSYIILQSQVDKSKMSLLEQENNIALGSNTYILPEEVQKYQLFVNLMANAQSESSEKQRIIDELKVKHVEMSADMCDVDEARAKATKTQGITIINIIATIIVAIFAPAVGAVWALVDIYNIYITYRKWQVVKAVKAYNATVDELGETIDKLEMALNEDIARCNNLWCAYYS